MPLASTVDYVESQFFREAMIQIFVICASRQALHNYGVELISGFFAQYQFPALSTSYGHCGRGFSCRFLRGISSRFPREVGFEVEAVLEHRDCQENHPPRLVLHNRGR